MKHAFGLFLLITVLNAAPMLFEAEDGILTGVAIYTTEPGFSGTGYVGNFANTGDKVTITVPITTAGSYQLKIIYYNANQDKVQDVYVNGAASGQLVMEASTTFDTAAIGGVWLNAGDNTISVHKNWGWAFVDAFILEVRPPNSYNPTTALIDANASAAAEALYARLLGSYGSQIISGLHDRRENMTGNYKALDSLAKVVGTMPIVRSFDFSDYVTLNPWLWDNTSGGHILGYVGADSRETEGMIAWDSTTDGCGIVEITWHWNAPIAEQAGVNNFSTANVLFDVREAVKNGTPENIALLEDIDSISMQMKRLADRNIPVLWRPLHEAGGAWFWWGAHGPDATKALWDILYDRMVNYHNLHNMIWVWSTPEVDWYPGNSKVDIVGFDSYPGPYEYGSQKSLFDHMYDLSDGEKMVALSENGPIPNIDAIQNEDALWAWWSTWSDMTFSENSEQHLIDVYGHADVLTLEDCIPSPVTALPMSSLSSQTVSILQNDKSLTLIGYVDGEWKIYNTHGRVIKKGYGPNIALKSLSTGVYHVKLGEICNETIRIK